MDQVDRRPIERGRQVIGVIPRDVYEVVSLASGRRKTSLILGIGAPTA